MVEIKRNALFLLQGITIQSKTAVENARKHEWPLTHVSDDTYCVEAPGGYKFYLVDQEPTKAGNVSILGIRPLTLWVDIRTTSKPNSTTG